MSCAKGNLLRLGEELINIPVEFKLSNISNWKNIFRPDLGSIEDIKVKLILSTLGANLYTEFPSREHALFDGGIEILSMKIGILATNLQRLVPNKRMDSKGWRKVELDERTNTVLIKKGESIDSKALHHAKGPWDTTIAHGPHEHMGSLGVQELEVPEVIVG
jgi:hypothetical protein